MHFIAHSQVRSEIYSLLHIIGFSQPAGLTLPLSSQDASKYTLSILPHTSPSLFSSTLPGMVARTLPLALDGTQPACWTVHLKTSVQEAFKRTPKHSDKYTPNCTRWHTPSMHDCILQSMLWRCSPVHSVCSQVHSPMLSRTLTLALDGTQQACLTVHYQTSTEEDHKHTPKRGLECASNCTQSYTPRILDSTLPCTLSKGKTLPISLAYILTCSLLHARSRALPSCRSQAPGSAVAAKSLSHHYHNSACQRTAWWQVCGDTGTTEMGWATGAYEHAVVTQMGCAMGSIYSGDPGVDQYYLVIQWNTHSVIPNFYLTSSFWDFVDPHSRVVSYHPTPFLRSSSQNSSVSRDIFGMSREVKQIVDDGITAF